MSACDICGKQLPASGKCKDANALWHRRVAERKAIAAKAKQTARERGSPVGRPQSETPQICTVCGTPKAYLGNSKYKCQNPGHDAKVAENRRRGAAATKEKLKGRKRKKE